MSIHISANPEEIAKTVLLAGDPLRAKFVADNFLKNVTCYNAVRNMLGFTGTIIGTKREISVQGSGMGMPSLSIYVNELINAYHVNRIIRIGSAGSLQKEIGLRSIVLAQGSCTDSAMNKKRFQEMTFAPLANWELLLSAFNISKKMKLKVHVGNIFATDAFYDEFDCWKIFAKYGVLAAEMETTELYTLAALHKIEALSILTISDNLVTGEKLSSDEREKSLTDSAVRLALCI